MENKVLIVGLGQIGLQYDLHLKQDEFTLTHSRAFSLHKNFNLLAGVDNDKEQRDIFSQTYSLPTYSSLTKALKAHNPDIVVVLGDRFEIIAASIAALFARIPIAHISGGETTIGAFDEAIRHSITKMSWWHFVSTKSFKNSMSLDRFLGYMGNSSN